MIYDAPVCPKPTITPDYYELISLHAHYRRGFLPTGGCVLDAPKGLMDALELMDTILHD